MKALVLLATLATISAESPETFYRGFLRSVDVYNFRAKCWGTGNADALSALIQAAKTKCMQMEGEDLPRSRRQVEELAGLQESVEEFVVQYGTFQEELGTKIGNLSCVLREVQWLNGEGEVNMDFWTTALTDPEAAAFDFTIEGSAASDPAWRQRLAEANQDCFDLSEAWPAKSLAHDPLTMIMGRPAFFFKCWNKVERRLCAEAEMLEWLEKIYGPTQPDTLQQLGLPADKFAAAGVSAAVLAAAESQEGRFVDQFMWRMDDTL